MNWVVYIISFISVIAGSQLIRYEEPIWGGLLLGLGLALARLSGVMSEIKNNSR